MTAAAVRSKGRTGWDHLAWVVGAGVLGIAVTAVFAGVLHMPRDPFVGCYVATAGMFLVSYCRWSRTDLLQSVVHGWKWGGPSGLRHGRAESRPRLRHQPRQARVHRRADGGSACRKTRKQKPPGPRVRGIGNASINLTRPALSSPACNVGRGTAPATGVLHARSAAQTEAAPAGAPGCTNPHDGDRAFRTTWSSPSPQRSGQRGCGT